MAHVAVLEMFAEDAKEKGYLSWSNAFRDAREEILSLREQNQVLYKLQRLLQEEIDRAGEKVNS